MGLAHAMGVSTIINPTRSHPNQAVRFILRRSVTPSWDRLSNLAEASGMSAQGQRGSHLSGRGTKTRLSVPCTGSQNRPAPLVQIRGPQPPAGEQVPQLQVRDPDLTQCLAAATCSPIISAI